MSVSGVTWKEEFEEWYENPQKLLAWLMHQFWLAQISPEENASWLIREGEIIIATEKKHLERFKRDSK